MNPSIMAPLMIAPALCAAMAAQQEEERWGAAVGEVTRRQETAREKVKQQITDHKRENPILKRKPIDILSDFCDW